MNSKNSKFIFFSLQNIILILISKKLFPKIISPCTGGILVVFKGKNKTLLTGPEAVNPAR